MDHWPPCASSSSDISASSVVTSWITVVLVLVVTLLNVVTTWCEDGGGLKVFCAEYWARPVEFAAASYWKGTDAGAGPPANGFPMAYRDGLLANGCTVTPLCYPVGSAVAPIKQSAHVKQSARKFESENTRLSHLDGPRHPKLAPGLQDAIHHERVHIQRLQSLRIARKIGT